MTLEDAILMREGKTAYRRDENDDRILVILGGGGVEQL